MKYLQNIKFYFVLLTLFSLWSSIMLYNSKQNQNVLNKKYMDLKIVSDSLESTSYLYEIELNRYTISYEILSEKNPIAAKQFMEIYSNETE